MKSKILLLIVIVMSGFFVSFKPEIPNSIASPDFVCLSQTTNLGVGGNGNVTLTSSAMFVTNCVFGATAYIWDIDGATVSTVDHYA